MRYPPQIILNTAPEAPLQIDSLVNSALTSEFCVGKPADTSGWQTVLKSPPTVVGWTPTSVDGPPTTAALKSGP